MIQSYLNFKSIVFKTLCVWLVVMYVSSCAPSVKAPIWLQTLPSDPCYFFGRGSAVHSSQDSAFKNATYQALLSIREQISISVEASSELNKTETDTSYTTHFAQTIRTRAQELKIEGHEQAYSPWVEGERVSVIYRLNRESFYRSLHNDYIRAGKEAKAFYESSLKQDRSGALAMWFKGLEVMSPYQALSFSYNSCKGEIHLNNQFFLEDKLQPIDHFLAGKIKEFISSLILKPVKSRYVFSNSSPEGANIEVLVSFKGRVLKNLALKGAIGVDHWSIENESQSNDSGIAGFKVEKVGSGTHAFSIRLAHSPADSVLSQYGINFPQVSVTLERPLPKVFLGFAETVNGQPIQIFTKLLSDKISASGAVLVKSPQGANVQIRGMVQATQNGFRQRVKFSQVSVDLNIKGDGEGEIKLSRQGEQSSSPVSFEEAGKRALWKAAELFSNDIINALFDVY